jgi:hypothetical protein
VDGRPTAAVDPSGLMSPDTLDEINKGRAAQGLSLLTMGPDGMVQDSSPAASTDEPPVENPFAPRQPRNRRTCCGLGVRP